MNILQKIPKLWQGVLIIFISAVYMNGWKEVTLVQFVERRWNSMRAHNEDLESSNIGSDFRLQQTSSNL
ncbi:hypothetical protein ZIOFF_023186 [Zingiber officinale]|uniref:Uncharacterized protein n=1 Tax=Zingiber officinale TaxID=94328 RepID=A0A8J5HML9_ZINOF|nr:hypothetical protein ZIOFF_023186 [Zingiber officinale]